VNPLKKSVYLLEIIECRGPVSKMDSDMRLECPEIDKYGWIGRTTYLFCHWLLALIFLTVPLKFYSFLKFLGRVLRYMGGAINFI